MFRKKKDNLTQIEKDNRAGEDISESKKDRRWLKATTMTNVCSTFVGAVIIVSYVTMPPPKVIIKSFDIWGNLVTVDASMPSTPQDRTWILKKFIADMRRRSGVVADDAWTLNSINDRISPAAVRSWASSHKLFSDLTNVKEGQVIQVQLPIEAYPDLTGQNIVAIWKETRMDSKTSIAKHYSFRATFIFKPTEETDGISIIDFVRLEHAEEVTGVEK